eukprot:COSAG06_NODE_13161_length_1283_cov_1.609428_1_plen_130_part_10
MLSTSLAGLEPVLSSPQEHHYRERKKTALLRTGPAIAVTSPQSLLISSIISMSMEFWQIFSPTCQKRTLLSHNKLTAVLETCLDISLQNLRKMAMCFPLLWRGLSLSCQALRSIILGGERRGASWERGLY